MVPSGSDDKTVKLCDAATGKETRKLEGHENPVTAVAFSPSGKTVALKSADNTVKLWDVATGEATRNAAATVEEARLIETFRAPSRVSLSSDRYSVDSNMGNNLAPSPGPWSELLLRSHCI
jgi:WD40 repeat protein